MRLFAYLFLCSLVAHVTCEGVQDKPKKLKAVTKTIHGLKYTANIDRFTVKISKNDVAGISTFTFCEMSITRDGTAEKWRVVYTAHGSYLEEVCLYAKDGSYLSLKHLLSPDTYVLEGGPYALEQNGSFMEVRVDRTADAVVEKDVLAKAKEKIAAGRRLLRIVKCLLGLETKQPEKDDGRVSMDETFRSLDEFVSKKTEREAMGKKAKAQQEEKATHGKAPAKEKQGKKIPKSGSFQAELYNGQGVLYWEGEMNLSQKTERAQRLANTFREILYLLRKGAFDDTPVTKEALEEKVKLQEALKFEPGQKSAR